MNGKPINLALEQDAHGVAMVVNAIPVGSENAIKRRDLCAKLGMSDRQVRKLIELARRDGNLIMNHSDGRGYYQSEDIDEIERQYWQEQARALSVLRRQKALRRRLVEAGRPVR